MSKKEEGENRISFAFQIAKMNIEKQFEQLKQKTNQGTKITKEQQTHFPWAVSPESMIASAPSLTAIAMSETSALVGVG